MDMADSSLGGDDDAHFSGLERKKRLRIELDLLQPFREQQ